MSALRDPVAIVGAGVVGLCTAWCLREAGLRVHVLEREPEVGTQTSFANGGLLTPAMSDPWNAPGIHWQLLRWLGKADAPMRLRISALPGYFAWGLRFVANTGARRYREAMRANYALAQFSVTETRALRSALALDYAAGTRGTLKLFREAPSLDRAAAQARQLEADGLSFEVLDRTATIAVEPALADVADHIVGALRFPHDETGDAHRFCLALKDALQARGVEIETGVRVDEIVRERGRVVALRTSAGEVSAGTVVVAAAAWSPALLDSLGIRARIMPVKGYSLTVPMPSTGVCPSIAIIDDQLHAAACPLDGALRLAGTAEFAGWDDALDPRRLAMLWDFFGAVLPRLADRADRSRCRAWCGFRPMSADGVAYIGASRVPGLYLNCGHGHLGWTQAAGSARLLAQLVLGEAPGIDAQAFDPGRRH